MSDEVLILPDDSAESGKQLDVEQLWSGSETVHRERMQVVGTAFAEKQAVKAADPNTKAYGSVVRPIPFANIKCKRFTFTTTQASAQVIDGTGIQIGVTRISVKAHRDISNNLECYMGFNQTTTPTTDDCVYSNPALSGGDKDEEGGGSSVLGIGASGDDLLIKTDVAPSGGAVHVNVSYFTIT